MRLKDLWEIFPLPAKIKLFVSDDSWTSSLKPSDSLPTISVVGSNNTHQNCNRLLCLLSIALCSTSDFSSASIPDQCPSG